jgi:hypothetical protein
MDPPPLHHSSLMADVPRPIDPALATQDCDRAEDDANDLIIWG